VCRFQIARETRLGSGQIFATFYSARSVYLALGADRFQLVGSSTVGTFTWPAEGSAALQLTGPVGGRYRQESRWRPQAGELTRFVGSHYSRELGVQYSLTVQGSHRTLQHRRLGRQTLVPTYSGGGTAGFYLAFTQGDDGAVDGFTISTQRAWKVRFDRQ